MNLVLYDTQKIYDDSFITWLINRIQLYFCLRIDTDKLVNIELYINTLSEYKSLFRSYISAKDVCISGIYNIISKRVGNKVTVEIDSNQILSGTNAKLYDICKLINYGSLSIRGYSIFSETFEYFLKNIDSMYQRYLEECK